MSDLIFADLSNFQATVNFAQLRGYSAAVGEEISWGTAVTIPSGRIAAIRAESFTCVLWYMGLRADQDVASQVNAFTATLGPLNTGEAVVIDWEESFGSTPSVSQREQAALLLAAYYKCDTAMIGTYGPASLLAANPPPSWVWAASYETTEPLIPHVIWQFTDGQYTSPPFVPVNFPGVGFCDANVFHGTAEELAVLASPIAQPKPVPPPPPLYGVDENVSMQKIYANKKGDLAQFRIDPTNGHVINTTGAPWTDTDLYLAPAGMGQIPTSPAVSIDAPTPDSNSFDADHFNLLVLTQSGQSYQLVNDGAHGKSWSWYLQGQKVS